MDDREEPRPMPPAAGWGLTLLVLAAVAALFIALCVLFRAAVVPLLIALLITALLDPLHHWLRRRGVRPGLAAGLSCLALVAVVDTAIWVLVRLIADAAGQLAASLEQAQQRASGADPAAQAVRTAAQGLGQLGGAIAEGLARGVLTGLGLAAQLLAAGVLTVALAFFLLRDRARVLALVRRITPPDYRDRAVRTVRIGYQAMGGFMRGTTIIAGIDATFITVGLTLIGVPHALGLGALVFVGAYVPYAGAFLSGLAAVVVAFADGGFGKALAALAVVLAVQVIEGAVLQPAIQSRTVALHPAVVLLAVTAGAAVDGLVGTLLAVPLTAAAFGITSELMRSHLPDR